MKTKCKPILVESKEHNPLRLDNNGKLTFERYIQGLYYARLIHTYQQLILISLDPNDKICLGDKYVVELFDIEGKSTGLHLETCNTINDVWINSRSIDLTRHIANCKKVIATQDQISIEYIQQFVDEYNKDEVRDVEIEIEIFTEPVQDGDWEKYSSYKPKLTNGFITIVNEEQILYTTQEVIKLLDSFGQHVSMELVGRRFEMIGELSKWFETNKKK